MVVQDGEVEVAALHLVHQPRFDVRVALVVDVADAVALPFEPREVFEQRRFLVDAGHHRLRDEAVAAEKENLIDRFGIAFRLHDLFQLGDGYLIGHPLLGQILRQPLLIAAALHPAP